MVNKFVFYSDSESGFTLNLPPLSMDSSTTGTIDWGDGNTSAYAYSYNTHAYTSAGTYTVTFITTDITSVGNGFCAGNSYIKEAYLSEGITLLDNGLFTQSSIQTLHIPSTAIIGENSPLNYCTSLTSITIGDKDNLTTIDITQHSYKAFVGCTSLVKIICYSNTTGINETYFITSDGYIPVYYTKNGKIDDDSSEEIRLMRIGSHMPSFRNIQVDRESYVIWKIALGSRIVWQLNTKTPTEYLLVDEYCIGEKYLESYTTQSVFTDVYWIHKVNGKMVQTSLNDFELNSWQCDTLTPVFRTNTSDNSKYVCYYELTQNSGFGQHNMKITYKSPDTNKILEVEYPIYHLEETKCEYGDGITWYPFRNYLNKENFGTCSLYYQCKDSDNNTLEEIVTFPKNSTRINYVFPKPDNADFYFGENQQVEYDIVSIYTNKEYKGTCLWNIRPYYDSRNTQKIFSQNMKDLQPLKLKVDINDTNFYYINKTTTYTADTVISPYYNSNSKKLPTTNSELYVRLYDTSTKGYVNGIYGWQKYTYQDFYELNHEKVTIGKKFIMPFIADDFCVHGISTPYTTYPASTGFIYWGDGTFSYYAGGYYFYDNSYTSQTDSTVRKIYTEAKLDNGYSYDKTNNNRTPKYIYPFKDKETQEHEYKENNIYDIIITSASESSCNYKYSDSDNNAKYDVCCLTKFFFVDSSNSNRVYSYWNDNYALINDELDVCNSNHIDFYNYTSPVQAQLKGLEFGNGFYTGYFRRSYQKNGLEYSNITSGYYGKSNSVDKGIFIGGGNISSYQIDSTLDGLLNLEYIKIPKINKQFRFGIDNKTSYMDSSFFNYSKSLKDIYYDGTRAEWNNIFTREDGTSYLNEICDGTDIIASSDEYKILQCFRHLGNNYHYRGLEQFDSNKVTTKYYNYVFNETYTLNIHCTDETFSVVLEPNNKWTITDFSNCEIMTFDTSTNTWKSSKE